MTAAAAAAAVVAIAEAADVRVVSKPVSAPISTAAASPTPAVTTVKLRLDGRYGYRNALIKRQSSVISPSSVTHRTHQSAFSSAPIVFAK